jgi:TPR repeat protein
MKKLVEVFGISPEYAIKLEQVGIRNLEDLAKTSEISNLSQQTSVPIDLLKQWYGFAKSELEGAASDRWKKVALIATVVAMLLADIVLWSLVVSLSADPIDHYYRGQYLLDEGKFSDAVSEFKKAATLGNVRAMVSLGDLYREGRYAIKIGPGAPKPFESNYQQALYWYEKAAASGSAGAMGHLGNMYLKGEGVAPDELKALYWFEKSADESDNAEGMKLIGDVYHEGQGAVAQDQQKAVYWYEKAAASGSAGAMRQLGDMYHKGEGVPPDELKALDWCKKALAAEGPKAK